MKLIRSFTIRMDLISNNKFYSSPHWRVRQKIAHDAHKLIIGQLKEQKIEKIIDGFPLSIKYYFYDKKKDRDLDNLGGTIKVINDSLVEAGILPDDNVKFINIIWKTHRISKNSRVVIKILAR